MRPELVTERGSGGGARHPFPAARYRLMAAGMTALRAVFAGAAVLMGGTGPPAGDVIGAT